MRLDDICAVLAGPTFAGCAMGPAEATALLPQAAAHAMEGLAAALLRLRADPTATVSHSLLCCPATAF